MFRYKTKKATVGSMYLHCNLWLYIIGTTNMEPIPDIANGDFNGPK